MFTQSQLTQQVKIGCQHVLHTLPLQKFPEQCQNAPDEQRVAVSVYTAQAVFYLHPEPDLGLTAPIKEFRLP